jgi:hypothetical protein
MTHKEQLYVKLLVIATSITPDVDYTYTLEKFSNYLSQAMKMERENAIDFIAHGIWRDYSFPHNHYDEGVPYLAKEEIEWEISQYLERLDSLSW